MARAQTQDVSKLPKWAQERIELLEMRVREAAAREAIGPADSNTFANPYAGFDESRSPTPLGRGTTIRFVVDDKHRREFTVRLDEDGELNVMASWLVAVVPQSSNVIKVRLCDD